ncbi:MAG: acetate uptake transporter [Jatrophihabitantaceae bacterium]
MARPARSPLQVLVVDDEPPAREELAGLLRQDPRVGDVRLAADGLSALRELEKYPFDAVFCDTGLPGLDGLELARLIGRFADQPRVVFVTASAEHAVDAFAVRAVDYLLKPVSRHRIAEAVGRVAEAGAWADPPDESIAIELAGVTRFVRRSEIRYVEAQGDYARLHTGHGSHLIRVPLATVAERWAGAGFVRIHRGTLVSVAHVDEIRMLDGHCSVRIGPDVLPVSRRHTRQVRDRLIRAARCIRAATPAPASTARRTEPTAWRSERAGQRLHAHSMLMPRGGWASSSTGQPFASGIDKGVHEMAAADVTTATPTFGAAFADPGPLGLAGFAMTTFYLSSVNAGWLAKSVLAGVLGLALFYGGLAQLLAGMWEFVKGNTFGALAFSSFGAFWLSYWYLVAHTDLSKANATNLGHGLGFYLLGWTIFTLYMFVASTRTNLALMVVLGLLTLTFFFLFLGEYTTTSGLTKVGGYLGILTALAAWYTSLAGVMNATAGRVILPVFPRDEASRAGTGPANRLGRNGGTRRR